MIWSGLWRFSRWCWFGMLCSGCGSVSVGCVCSLFLLWLGLF